MPNPVKNIDDKKDIIQELVTKGYTNAQIIDYLMVHSNKIISLSLLKKRLKLWGISRKQVVNDEIVKETIVQECTGINRDAGYRAMQHILRMKYNMHVPRDKVLKMQHEVDSIGLERRKKQKLVRRTYFASGPNYQWCIDGHDKLVPYGLAIHGAIDAWSGKILWLRVWSSNHNPRLICQYFIQTMRQLKVAPYITRSDSGTENVGVAAIQAVLHAEFNASDTLPDKHHQFVASTRNIKIEALWSRFLKAKGFTLMDTLKEGFEIGIYDPEDTFEYFLFLYIWIPLIQRYLTEYLEHCNSLRRQKTKNSILPTEKPNICFYNPLQFSGLECGFEVNESVLKFLEMEYCSNSSSLIYIPSEFKDSADLLFSKLQFGQYDVCSAWDVFTVMKTTWENI